MDITTVSERKSQQFAIVNEYQSVSCQSLTLTLTSSFAFQLPSIPTFEGVYKLDSFRGLLHIHGKNLNKCITEHM